ncbi:hypothetical protein UFOVP257_144 [uncultured Caudovirales phage]|uniref:Uncharacterized protein n=1 Tax=uncultured Caudovirales phage TaxID=2100421 RepID=A0A6J5LGK2_9CAUD|nr:hypothetical protein UFOVP257_144 [uncultured Caudovirales phage]
MRIREVILEDALDEIIEDEANDPVISYLLEVLHALHDRSRDTHVIPRVRADSLINIVQLRHPQFNLDILEKAKTNNEQVKSLIKDIKDDNTGVKYVYLTPFADEQDEMGTGMDGESAPKTAPEKTVDSMAKSALANRS